MPNTEKTDIEKNQKSEKGIRPEVLVAIIGGCATIITTIIAGVFALKAGNASPQPTSTSSPAITLVSPSLQTVTPGISPTVSLTPSPTVVPVPSPTAPLIPSPVVGPLGGTLVLDDPLENNSAGRWDSDNPSSTGDGCRFIQNAYHINSTNYFHQCSEHGNDFANVVFQVKIILNQGSSGGIIFRAASTNFYYFTIGWSGHFDFLRNDQGTPAIEFPGVTTPDSQRTYILEIKTNNSLLEFYVNNQKVYSANDSTYSHGSFALFVDGSHESTTPVTQAIFSDLKVWEL